MVFVLSSIYCSTSAMEKQKVYLTTREPIENIEVEVSPIKLILAKPEHVSMFMSYNIHVKEDDHLYTLKRTFTQVNGKKIPIEDKQYLITECEKRTPSLLPAKWFDDIEHIYGIRQYKFRELISHVNSIMTCKDDFYDKLRAIIIMAVYKMNYLNEWPK